MSVMLGDIAVTAVVKRINGAKQKGDLLEDFTGSAYKYERPAGTPGEYIVVNHLPFVHRKDVEEGTVNVNIHVPVLNTSLPDVRRLGELASAIVELFPEGTVIDDLAYYEFYSDSRPTLEEDKTYYVNIQLNVTFTNLNYKE